MQPSSTLAQQAVSRALQYLAATPGVLYKVVYEGEVLADNFPFAAPPPPSKKARVILHNFARDIGYAKELRALEPGQTLSWLRNQYALLSEERAWLSFISSVKSTAHRLYKPDDFLWEISAEKICLLYVPGSAL